MKSLFARIKAWWNQPDETEVLFQRLEKALKEQQRRRWVVRRHETRITLQPGKEMTLYDSNEPLIKEEKGEG